MVRGYEHIHSANTQAHTLTHAPHTLMHMRTNTTTYTQTCTHMHKTDDDADRSEPRLERQLALLLFGVSVFGVGVVAGSPAGSRLVGL